MYTCLSDTFISDEWSSPCKRQSHQVLEFFLTCTQNKYHPTPSAPSYSHPSIDIHQQFYCLFNSMPGQIYKNKSKLQQYWSLARGVTGVQRIPCTRDQQCGKHIIEKMIKTFWTKYYTLSISLRLGMTWCWTQYKGRMLKLCSPQYLTKGTTYFIHPYGQAMGHSLWDLWRRFTAHSTSAVESLIITTVTS